MSSTSSPYSPSSPSHIKPYKPIAIALFALLFIFWICCTIYMLRQFWCKQNDAISKATKIFTSSYFICYSVAYCCISTLTALALLDQKDFWMNDSNDNQGGIGWPIMIAIITCNVSIGYLSRSIGAINSLYLSFKGSYFEVRQCTIAILTILSMMAAGLLCFFGISYFLFREQLFHPLPNLMWAISTTGVFCNFIMAFTILYLLNYKLHSLVASTREFAVKPIELDKHSLTMLQTATKHTLLNSIAIIAFNVCIPMLLMLYALNVYVHNGGTFIFTIYGVLIFHSLEMICVCLGYKFMEDMYFKVCGLCNNWCQQTVNAKMNQCETAMVVPPGSPRTPGSDHSVDLQQSPFK